MIKIAFIGPQRKIIKFEIENKKVRYFDEIWMYGIQILPKDLKMISKMSRSRDGNMRVMAALILDANKGEALKEYESCKTDEDITDMIRKDCLEKGLMEVK